MIGLSFNDSVYAQSYTGVLDLDYISSTAYSGDKITFSGYLTTTSGHIVPDATIKIKDNVRFGSDTTIKTLTTDSGGYFSGTWTAQVRDSGAWDFYAVFDGSSDVEQARSDTYNVQVYSSSSSSSSSDDMFDDSYSDDMFDDSYSEPMYSDEYSVGVLNLDSIQSVAYSGDPIVFSGYLTTTSGHVVPDATITIKDNVRAGSDTTIMTLTTDTNGYFSEVWAAQARSGAWDFYAVFDGSSDVEQARSNTYSVEVSKQSVNLILDPLLNTVSLDDTIQFSGYLTTAFGYPIPDATITIKDNVRAGSDTTIMTLTTDVNGYFSGIWIAQARSGAWDFYAQFDGSFYVEEGRSDTYNVEVHSSSKSSSNEFSTGVLVLDYISSTASSGDTIQFSGYLTTTSGNIVSDATITIKDNVRAGSDPTIMTLTTDTNGYFSGTWTAKVRSSGAWDFYAEFDGSSNVRESRSDTYSVEVSKQSVDLVLDPIHTSARPGDTIQFSGYLTTPFGYPITYETITIKDNVRAGSDSTIMTLTTDTNGYFSGTWTAKVRSSGAWDFYAQYAGSSSVKDSRSYTYSVVVSKYPTSITLDSLPASARIGERITFSGILNIDSHNPENSVVYIKDNDFIGFDDLLATAFVDSNGQFSTTWFVTDVDLGSSNAEIFAVYEGNKFTDRAVTAQAQLSILDPLTSTPPTPSDDEYMELYYSLPFDKTPLVAISLEPGFSDQVREHIIPVKEGIMMLTSQLEQKFGGSWNVDFDVIYPGSSFTSKPNIIINLITHQDDANCDERTYGWANIYDPDPDGKIQTYVCSISSAGQRNNAGISSTAAHEFIHAMGLGHTFFKNHDIMCSVEADIPTCEKISPKDKSFSNLNLEAIKALYGSDGFLDPNNNIVHKTQFPINNFNNWDDSNPIIQTTTSSPKIVTTSPTTELTTTSSPSPTPSCAELILNAIFTSESLDDISCLNSFFAFFNQ